MIAVVRDDTVHTRVTRCPGVETRGILTHTMPASLPTSTAATRATISGSVESSSTKLPVICIVHAPRRSSGQGGLPGGPTGNQNLIGVLEATVRNPSTQAPAPD